jgi:hypothetical protein
VNATILRTVGFVAAATLLCGGVLSLPSRGSADTLPSEPAAMPVVATVSAVTRLGGEGVFLVGRLRTDGSPPHDDGGYTVVDLDVTEVALQGASQLGIINVSASAAPASTGELRSIEPAGKFPASSSLDLYLDVSAPASPIGPLTFHNEDALVLRPRSGDIEQPIVEWPPLGATLHLDPVFEADNDSDGAVDEDSADEDGDGLVDEDRPGPDPATPGMDACGDDADCDLQEGEDPPADLCSPAVCDADSDGTFDEDPACIPMLNETGTHLKLGLCIRDVVIEVGPGTPSYSVVRGGRGVFHPADIFGLLPAGAASQTQPPFVRLACQDLGLSADGCDDGGDGDQDDLDAFSFGDDLAGDGPGVIEFSVSPDAQGAAGTDVRGQVMCPPAQPGLSPEAEPDIFRSTLDGSNLHLFDGNGPVGSCASAFPLGLTEAATARDDLDALDMSDATTVDTNGDGVPESPVYFSLDAGSPSLSTLGASAADVLVTSGGAAPEAYATAAALGLQAGDDLDGLCLADNDATFGAADTLRFSLAPGSSTLAAIGAGPGDVLAPGSPPAVATSALSLGLLAGDDADAMDCSGSIVATGNGDANCDGRTDPVDALIILQYDAGLSATLPCLGSADVNLDSVVNSIDVLLVLQFALGLIPQLPW